MQYYYKTKSGEVVELLPDKSENLYIGNKKIIELVIPTNCQYIDCSDNLLTSLKVPENCTVVCENNKLTNLILSKGIKEIHCSENNLTELIVPEGCREVYCNNNQLSVLQLPENCKLINCSENKLTELTIPNGCQLINCGNNKLKILVVPFSCTRVLAYMNENLEEVIITNEKTKVEADDWVYVKRKKIKGPDFNKTDKVISDLILKIKNPVLWSIADQITKELTDLEVDVKIDIKKLKKLANDNVSLGQMLSKKEGQELLKANSSGFSIQDIQKADFYNQESLLQNKFIEISHSIRDGAQRYFKNKTNHVFQINLKTFKDKELINSFFGPQKSNLRLYKNESNHPTSRANLTLAWVRYTYLEDRNAIVIDEIQTDLDDDRFLGKELMQGWDEFTMKLFVQYVRKQFKIRKIYMPTYDSKKKLYDANPPMYLYKELPNKFGFKKTSDFEGFMVLEKFGLPSFEEYNLI